MKTYLMQDKSGQILSTKSVSAGLDYPGVDPEHSYLKILEELNMILRLMKKL